MWKRRVALASLATVLSFSACSDPETGGDDAGSVEDAGDLGHPDVTMDAGGDAGFVDCGEPGRSSATIDGWSVAVDHADGMWTLTAPDAAEPLVTGPATCGDGPAPIRLGSGEPKVETAFGAFKIDLEEEGAKMEWSEVSEVVPRLEESGEAVRLVWPEVSLRFATEGTDRIHLELLADSADAAELSWGCASDEAFFGLGSQVTGMNLRGKTYPLWTQEQGNGKPEGGGIFPLNNFPEAAYAPMGVWHSSAGWSAVVGHDAFSEVDLCETDPGIFSLRSYPELPSLVLITGETPKDRLTTVTEYTGRLTYDPPDWIFGLWVDAVDGPWRVQEVADVLRDNDIPASAIWTEDWIGHAKQTTGFRLTYEWSWDEETYPDLPQTITDLHARGFAFLGYFNPFVPKTVSTWDEAAENGYLIERDSGDPYVFQDPAFRPASLVDLSDPDAVSWLQGYQKTAAEDLGIDGWMADFAEWLPVDASIESGEDPWRFHNRYPLEWQRANRGSLAEAHAGGDEADNNWAFFPRSGWASANGGTAGIAPAMWGGDQNTDWGYDDGFPTIVPISAHLGLAGVAIFGSDIAGYNSLQTENTDKELFFRWSATAAFHPLMRTHHGGDACANWNFDRDGDTLQHFARWARVHARLYPYFRGLVADARERGWPMTRHPFLVEPDASALWEGDDYVFFVGDDILVAPVLEDDATSRDVKLPDSGWWPLFGDEPLQSASETVTAEVTEVPAFVRPGTALVTLKAAPDSFYGATDGTTTDLDDVGGALGIALYPDDGGIVAGEGGGISADGTGWSPDTDLSAATADGASLPECGTVAGPRADCYDAATQTVLLYDVSQATTITADSADLEVVPDGSRDLAVAIGGDAWGTLGDPTTFSGPNGDAPSWCDGAPE